MKKALSNLAYMILGGTLIAGMIPLTAMGARTSPPVLTGLFPSTQVAINLPPPSISLGNATTTGSVYSNGGNALYFQVTALDNVGESLGSQLLGTSTVDQAHGWNITWTAVKGAVGYRVYFSTSTPLSMLQYFTATTTNDYTFTSTSSPVFATSGPPASNGAYVAFINSNGSSWFNGGSVGVGTSTPPNLLSVVNEPAGTGVVATTTVLFGDNSTTTSRTCINVVNAAGTAVSFYINAGNTITVEAKKCL